MPDEDGRLADRVERLERDFEEYREWRGEVRQELRDLRNEISTVAREVREGLSNVQSSLGDVTRGALNSMPAWGAMALTVCGMLAASAAVWALAVHHP